MPNHADLEFVKIVDNEIPKVKKYIEILCIKYSLLSNSVAIENGHITLNQTP